MGRRIKIFKKNKKRVFLDIDCNSKIVDKFLTQLYDDEVKYFNINDTIYFPKEDLDYVIIN